MGQEILSKEIVLSFGGNAIAMANDWTLSVNKEIIDVSTLDDAKWRKIVSDQISWSISISGLVARAAEAGKTHYDDLLNHLATSDEDVEAMLSTGVVGETFKKGMVQIASLEESGSKGAVVSYSATLEGNKALTIDTVVV